MSSIGEPDPECVAELVPATLGNTTAYTKDAFLQGDGTIYRLPSELHVNIMAHLDPVSQMCFGLTSHYFYQIFHEVRDLRYGSGERRYNIKTFPLDLAMQVSVCGNYSLFGWYEYWFLMDNQDIGWELALGDLLLDEKWLWRDRTYCWRCPRYKPAVAFEKSPFEYRVFEEYEKKLMTLEGHIVKESLENCQRCRAKALLVFLTGREEAMEFPHPWEESRSLGLVRPANAERALDENSLLQADSWEKRDAITRNYERWEDIFARLDI